jgi:hypothetical protein
MPCALRMALFDALKPTPKGFEPSRAEPSGFLVHLLNHSDTVSLDADGPSRIFEHSTSGWHALQGIVEPAEGRQEMSTRFVGLMAMTPASHAGGRRFNPATKYCFVFGLRWRNKMF